MFNFVLVFGFLSSGDGGGRLLEVLAHELLKVEVCELIGRLECEQLLQLRVRVDLSAVRRILELVRADVGVDLPSHLCARNKRTLRLRQELGKLVANEGGLHEPTWGAVANLSLALARNLLRRLKVALGLLLNGLELGDKGGDLVANAGELSVEVRINICNISSCLGRCSCFRLGNDNLDDNLLGLLGGSLSFGGLLRGHFILLNGGCCLSYFFS